MADANSNALQVSVVTPEGAAYEGEAANVVAPAFDGEVAFYPMHAPYVGVLGFGELRITRPDGETVGLPAAQLQAHPGRAGGGILVECIGEGVVGIGAAHLVQEVLIAVVVEIAEGHSVTLLQVTEAGGEGHVDETPAAVAVRGVHSVTVSVREMTETGQFMDSKLGIILCINLI